MRTSRSLDEHAAEVARRRLEALTRHLSDPKAAPAAEEVAPRDPVGLTTEQDAPTPSRPRRGRHARRPVGATRRAGLWLVDRLPATVQGHVHLGSAQLGVVALVVAVGLLATTWWLVRGGSAVHDVAAPAALAAPAPAVPSGGADPAPAGAGAASPGQHGAAGGSSAAPRQTVVVDVAGKVRRPGVVELPMGSRVVDALEAAGGVRRSVDVTALNLARVLLDGEQLLVGVAQVPAPAVSGGVSASPSPADPASGALVNINTADAAALQTLPGVGPVTAGAIITWRTENGPFTAVEELLEVSGIGPATLSELLPHVTI